MTRVWCSLRRSMSEVSEVMSEVLRALHRIERKQDLIMALVAIEQGDLDAIAVTVSQSADALQAVLDSETPLSPADEAGVQDALTKLKSVGPRVPTNAPPVPDPDPAPTTDEPPVDQPPVDPAPTDLPPETTPTTFM